jgi:cobalt-zinc-cadmium efflux system outer membrane protein
VTPAFWDLAQLVFCFPASLLDFLDAERSYRSTELSYRQALASCLTAQEQLREAVGTRDLQ